MTLDLTGKHYPVIFTVVLFFVFKGIMHAKMQVFLNQLWRQMHASLILLFGKNKSQFFGKDLGRKKLRFLPMLFAENKIVTSTLKWGGCFSMKWKATCKN